MNTPAAKIISRTALALVLIAIMAPLSASAQNTTGAKPAQFSASARQQISELLAEKAARTPVQRKIGSSLLYMAKMKKGISITPNVRMLRPLVPERPDGLVDVQIRGQVTKPLIEAVQQSGGKVVYGHLNGPLLRALVPLESVEVLAGRSEVRGISQSLPAATQQQLLKMRTEGMRTSLQSAVDRLQKSRAAAAPVPASVEGTGSVVSEGVKAHRADDGLHLYGATGAGVNIGVLSDSDDFKEDAISTGDLPADTITVPGQDGRPGSGEGTAMMEIVHDVAPNAKLFFASAFNGPESFADNIRTLRFTYHCDIIVDDVIYFFESPYQDDIIAKAVNDVIADGAQYFSSAGNGGNFDDGTSGTWEGDFKKAKQSLAALPPGYEIHDFGKGVISNRINAEGGPLILHWSDPGSLDNPQAADDYDLFVLDSTLSTVVVASTDVQDGTGLPFEFLGYYIPPDYQVVVARHTGATDRALRVVLFGGGLGIATAGSTYGHNSANGAFGVAAVDVAEALPSGVFTGGPTNGIEFFSSDGYRRVFFDPNGNPYKPGKYLFKNSGGQVRKHPDLAAADGVSTTLPSGSGLNPFFGTSAAAPHAAAIAGLIKSIQPGIKSSKLRSALTKSALDIEAPGQDRDSGFGIVDTVGAMSFINAKPTPFLELGALTITPTSGDGDAFLEPGESASALAELKNIGGTGTIHLNGVLSTTTPGVTILNGSSTYPAIPGFGGSAVNNTPYSFSLSSGLVCGTAPTFSLNSTYNNGNQSPQTFTFKVQTGQPTPNPVTTSYTNPPVSIPDDDPAGVDIPLTVSGVGAISKAVFSIDGASCSADAGSTTVGLDHTWVGDLVVKLTSPSGTTVVLMNRPGGTGNSGNNFCQTVLDDGAATSIQNIAVADAPWTGTFQPANPLAAFIGENADGTWVLNVSDNAFIDSGNVRAFSLALSGFTCN